MAERYRRRGALAHLGLEARARVDPADADLSDADLSHADLSHAGVVLGERRFRGMLVLRGDAGSAEFRGAVVSATGLEPVVEPLTSERHRDVTMLWLGPDEWLVVMPDRRVDRVERALRAALDGQNAALVDVSHSRTVIALSGPDAREVLVKGCPLDFHPRAFPSGRCAQSTLAKCQALIHLVNPTPEFEVYVAQSFAEYAWTWLEDAAAEFEVAISPMEQGA